ncbi:DUF3592 domain-containing protein [Blastopirellula marina]|uniref:DUF3592 domain-containing protein n=1 Tax=Blastopirellula marina TaxID=124 RepID=A0A2S8FX08_9BACT|nr:DUF3592 domain-containing protein [Blastopirellula marina]PQO36600.1 hypothetical protein C5Y98_11430 [Blastopirellula marina]PTL44430.1 DUF3592 domain-containing protein [Blastopirellula marina]
MSDQTMVILVLGMLNLFGVLIVLRGIWDVYSAWRTSFWERVPGQITSATIEEKVHKNSKSRSKVYEVKTTYQYDVYGRPYQGEKIAPSYIATTDQLDHQNLLDWLNSAGSLSVFYNPNHPEQSVLLPGIDRGMFSTISVGLIWLAVTGGITGMFYLIHGGDPALIQSIVGG